jgi:hypothetical protein
MSCFEFHGVIHECVHFYPAITINCNPPYVTGQVDSCYVTYHPRNRPKTKKSWEKAIGMQIIGMPH